MAQAETGVDVFFCHKTEDKIEGLPAVSLKVFQELHSY